MSHAKDVLSKYLFGAFPEDAFSALGWPGLHLISGSVSGHDRFVNRRLERQFSTLPLNTSKNTLLGIAHTMLLRRIDTYGQMPYI